MNEIAFIIGIAAVCLYLLGYLQKKRRNIILLNLSSRILYVLQYVMLGAFEGAGLDICGSLSSVLAQNKHRSFIKKHFKIFFIGANLVIVAVGLSLWVDFFSLLPIIGVLLHTSAFWMDDERKIRIVSLLGCPFWLIYNLVSGAYGSCIGDVLSIVSLCISIYRYDVRGRKSTSEATE
jgi:hypothetical protein